MEAHEWQAHCREYQASYAGELDRGLDRLGEIASHHADFDKVCADIAHAAYMVRFYTRQRERMAA